MQDMEDVKLYEEQCVIGRILVSPEMLDELPNLEPEYFTNEANKNVFSSIKKLYNNGKEITPLSVFKDAGKDFGNYIVELSSMFPPKNVVRRYSKEIAEKGKNLWMSAKVKEIMEKSNVDDVDISTEIKNIQLPKSDEDVADFKESLLKKLEWKMNHKDERSGIQSGLCSFDDATNGFNKGLLYICAGRSSMGKSAFMTSIVSKIEKSHKVGIVSLEMTKEELATRVCSINTNIPYWVIDRGQTTAEQFDRVYDSTQRLTNLVIDDRGGKNCSQVCSTIRKMVAGGCDIVFIDHIGIIQVDSRGNLAHEIGKITASLKTLAKELNIPIVALCQVNRGVEGEKDKRPKLSDLRDSGRIEEDADCVFFLYREEYYHPVKDSSGKTNRYEKAEVIIQKNRNGACTNIKCNFDNQLMKFYE